MEDLKINDDVLNRRLKNRERQRRYRARKRLEAVSTNADATIQQPEPFIISQEVKGAEVQKQVARAPVNDMSRIYCKRDWKKDARVAHLTRRPASVSTGSTNSPAGPSHESEAPHLLLQLRGETSFGSESHVKNPPIVDKSETKTSAPIRRDWKAAARSKTK
uniref:BZIP domain-containing protein n=1 Tax=Kalanchoe fedtschenkoi TaxID=63787 RepID=A0A7N0UW54_KALFE